MSIPKNVHMKKVNSTNLWKVGYDNVNRELYIIFLKRKQEAYVYAQVTPVVYKNLMNADSQGEYFADKIKDRYTYRAVNI